MKTTTGPMIVLEHSPVGKNGLLHIAAVADGQMIYGDKLDPRAASARKRFCEALAGMVPGLAAAEIETELLRIGTEAGGRKRQPDVAEAEILVARPELGHRVEASWLTIPSVSMGGDGPVGRWFLFVRWSDGRRERRSLETALELADGQRLWLYPQPAPPAMTQSPGWSAEGRAAWLAGESAPNPADLFKSLCARLAYFLDFQPEMAAGTTATLALWTLLTYIYPVWGALPYLSVGGPLSSGKSRVFETLARIVFRPMVSANLTAPTLFRSLHENGGTLLLDEAERLKDGSPEAGELRSILLSGYKAGAPARRLEPTADGKFRPVCFDVFGPKAIAGIGNLPEALASRCVRVCMFRAAPDSPRPRRRIDEDPDLWERLRDGLHALALEHGATWLDLARRDDVCPAMDGRSYELWQPILALAGWVEDHGADGLLAMVQEHAARIIESARDDSLPDCDELLLRLLTGYVTSGLNQNIAPGDLLKRAQEQEPVTFARWSGRGVSAALKRYGIEATKTHGNRIYRDVGLRQIVNIERAYGLDLGLNDETRKLVG